MILEARVTHLKRAGQQIPRAGKQNGLRCSLREGSHHEGKKEKIIEVPVNNHGIARRVALPARPAVSLRHVIPMSLQAYKISGGRGVLKNAPSPKTFRILVGCFDRRSSASLTDIFKKFLKEGLGEAPSCKAAPQHILISSNAHWYQLLAAPPSSNPRPRTWHLHKPSMIAPKNRGAENYEKPRTRRVACEFNSFRTAIGTRAATTQPAYVNVVLTKITKLDVLCRQQLFPEKSVGTMAGRASQMYTT